MSVNPALVSQMLELDSNAASQLHELLLKEAECLKTREHTTLGKLAEAKAVHIEVLDAHARERSALLDSLGLDHSVDGWLSFMQSDAQLTKLLPAWESLQTQVQQCKELNEKNGKLIHRSQQTLQRLLDLVKGNTAQGNGLYNAKGTSTQSAGSGSIVKA